MIKLIRCDSSNADFQSLIKDLDKVLWSRYQDIQKQYDGFNTIDTIKNVVIAYMGDNAVGCGSFKQFDESTVEIKRMFVAEENRGKGIARSILKELEAWAAELNYENTVLETGKRLSEAMALYEKHGYIITDNYGQYIGMENSVCMRKKLDKIATAT